MANWKTLTGDNIRLLDTERTIMANATPLQDLDTCMQSACDFVRGYVAGGGNIVEATGVPPECVDDAIVIARYSYLAQDPTGTLLTDIRKKEKDDALAHLRDIAKELSAVTQGATTLPPLSVGKWGSAQRIAMITENVPPP